MATYSVFFVASACPGLLYPDAYSLGFQVRFLVDDQPFALLAFLLAVVYYLPYP